MMKIFLFKLTTFSLIIVSLDVACGDLFSHLNAKAKGGNNGKTNYIINDAREDILVFGSSRAYEHYNPLIISDITGHSCYNCGILGSGIIANYGLLQQVHHRYRPKLVIYDIYPRFDLIKGEDNHKYLGTLRPYYDKGEMKEIFESVDPTEKYKMLSSLYQYNTEFIEITVNAIMPIHQDNNGFAPIDGKMDMMKVNKSWGKGGVEIDPLKKEYLNKLFGDFSDTKIVAVVSPTYSGLDKVMLRPIMDICKNRGIPFYDYSNDSTYLFHSQYFVDGSHLNLKGANKFTSELISRLKNDIYQD